MERIKLHSLSKEFQIGTGTKKGALAHALSLFSGREKQESFWALQDVSFRAESGEIIGIIGTNGSGKSTLLRLIAGIYAPTHGAVETVGNVISIINLNLGMQPRLTMHQNIYLVGALFGLSQQTIHAAYADIVTFSELEKFTHTKLYQFSEGMKQRLAFSIAAHTAPDVLLLDEVFEVGDESFCKKSAHKIQELVHNGATALLVSHDLSIIERYATRVAWIKKGRIHKTGEATHILQQYTESEDQ